MIDLIREASTLQFILGVIGAISGVMILLQALINRAVHALWLVLFFAAVVGLAVTLR
jgi:uncharacterized membrane protein YeaQ/YmgE (transglycosylase-associated protein family)